METVIWMLSTVLSSIVRRARTSEPVRSERSLPQSQLLWLPPLLMQSEGEGSWYF